MKKKLFLQNTIILTISSLVLRAVSVSFGAYLSRKIGTEGMGLYQLVFSVYGFASTLATSGIYLTVTRLVAEAIAKKSYSDANDTVRKCMIYGAFVSIASSLLLFFFAEFIATEILNDKRALLSLKLLAFALPFMAFSSTLRGYFFAIRNVIKSTSSQIFEQLVRMATVSMGLTLLLPKGLTYSCAAIALGSVTGELLAFLYTFFLYIKDRNRRIFVRKSKKENTKKVLSITVPVALSSYLRSALVTIENILIPKGLKRYGATSGSALSQYGMIEAMVMPLLTFPSAFLTSFANLLIPELAQANATGDKARINRLVSDVLKITLLFSFPVTAFFITAGETLGLAVYKSAEAGITLQILAPLIPILYTDIVTDAMLKGLDKQVNSLSFSIIDSASSILLICLLIPIYGVKGYVIVIFATAFINTVLSINCLISFTEIPFSVKDSIFKPVFISIISSFLIFTVFEQFEIPNPALKSTLQILSMALSYYLLLIITKTIKPVHKGIYPL